MDWDELTEGLPPKADMPDPEKTRFPDSAPEVRDVADTYVDLLLEQGFSHEPGPHMLKAIASGARDWYEEYGVDRERMAWALKQAVNGGTIIKSPRSLIGIAMGYKAESGPAPFIAKGDWINGPTEE